MNLKRSRYNVWMGGFPLNINILKRPFTFGKIYSTFICLNVFLSQLYMLFCSLLKGSSFIRQSPRPPLPSNCMENILKNKNMPTW